MQPLLPWKCSSAFLLYSLALYVAVNNRRNFTKICPVAGKLIHVVRRTDMMKLICAFQEDAIALNRLNCVLQRMVFAVVT
jgi:hypothetical protein